MTPTYSRPSLDQACHDHLRLPTPEPGMGGPLAHLQVRNLRFRKGKQPAQTDPEARGQTTTSPRVGPRATSVPLASTAPRSVIHPKLLPHALPLGSPRPLGTPASGLMIAACFGYKHWMVGVPGSRGHSGRPSLWGWGACPLGGPKSRGKTVGFISVGGTSRIGLAAAFISQLSAGKHFPK